jgi:long-chain acyl-CoA synthetase
MGGCASKVENQDIQYSVEVGPELPGGTRELRNPKYVNAYLERPFPEVHSMKDLYVRSFSTFGSRPCLGTRNGNEYHWKTYKQVYDEALHFGSGLISKKLCREEEQGGYNVRFLAIYSKNCEKWHVADFASGLFGISTVPLYDTLGTVATEFILNETELKTVFLSNDKIDAILELKANDQTGRLKNLVSFETADEEIKGRVRDLGLKIYSFEEIVEYGKTHKVEVKDIDPGLIHTISYTSGTTGNPKGVVMTHRTVLAQLAGIIDVFQPTPDDVHICYLPLAHVYERCLSNSMILQGAQIGYYSGDVLKLKEDLAVLRPTILACVPRLLSRFYDLINANINSLTGLKGKLARKALQTKLETVRYRAEYTHGLYDKLVFSKINKVLGGRVRMGTTASAPIAAEVLNFLKVAFCCQILEAYGQTENGGAATATSVKDHEIGHVGGPVGCLSIRLVDIPEMNYVSTNRNEKMELTPCGELCFKGPSIMPGYFKNSKITSEAIDPEGWLHSGDVGLLRPNGSIKIIDRKKNIFKLAQGEYIAPEKIENIYIQSKYVAFVFVYGDSLQSYTVAVIVPERTTVEPLAQSLGLQKTWEELCKDLAIKNAILKDIETLGKEAKLNGMEQVKKIHLHPEVITPEGGLLTPTFKIKRFDMRNHFKEAIDELYRN